MYNILEMTNCNNREYIISGQKVGECGKGKGRGVTIKGLQDAVLGGGDRTVNRLWW